MPRCKSLFRFLTVTEVRDYLIAGENIGGSYSGMQRIIICGEVVPLVMNSYSIARIGLKAKLTCQYEILSGACFLHIKRPPFVWILTFAKNWIRWFAVDVNMETAYLSSKKPLDSFREK
jgi:hypothetical protein